MDRATVHKAGPSGGGRWEQGAALPASIQPENAASGANSSATWGTQQNGRE
jgi:hypothetical protein